MKIVICGSICFYDDFVDLRDSLTSMWHYVILPESEKWTIIPSIWDDNFFDRKNNLMIWHFYFINNSDALLAANYEKKWILWYIWANTLIEMWVAMYLNKKIYILNDPSQNNSIDEILWMKAVVLNGDLSKIY